LEAGENGLGAILGDTLAPTPQMRRSMHRSPPHDRVTSPGQGAARFPRRWQPPRLRKNPMPEPSLSANGKDITLFKRSARPRC